MPDRSQCSERAKSLLSSSAGTGPVGAETARRAPAVRIVVGERDDPDVRGSAEQLDAALTEEYADPAAVDLVTVPGMPHELAEGPEQTPTEHAARVDRLVVDFPRPHLT